MLATDIMYLPGVGPKRKETLQRELAISTWGELLEYYPYKYVDRSRVYTISELDGTMPFVQIRAKILSFEEIPMKAHKRRVVAHVSDGQCVADIVWWNGGKYITDRYKVGKEYIFFGRPTAFAGRWQMSNPDVEDATAWQQALESGSGRHLQPYYITTERMKKFGLMSKQMERLTQTLVETIASKGGLPETLPEEIRERLHLVSRTEALTTIHYPHSLQEVQRAQMRLKFEELFYVQLNILRHVADRRQRYHGVVFERVGAPFNEFYSDHLPFELTGAQKRVIREMREDMRSGKQMNRLLQGDVGSGKTLVALLTMLIAIGNGYQAVLMAPTEILAEQHLQTIRNFLGGMDLRVELLTGAVKGKQREAVLEGLREGTVNILVGTHAVIEENVQFARLGIAVIDEQHRFGVAQRAKLWEKSGDCKPHVLVMTATPIPRTLAMTLYGDLDVSVIDELPPGRKPITTMHFLDRNQRSLYNALQREMDRGRQIYIVYPLIQESEKIDLKNLEDGYNQLQEAFPHVRMSKIHGKMKPKEKDEEMARFAKGETQMLVATTVIEVGVNVPNASVMVVFEAQRFGLSQLQQLRGREGRGAEKSYCKLVTGHELSKETRMRIDIMCQTNDGFQIAEADLKLRGPGDLEGTQQSGVAFDLKIADIARDGQIVQLARDEAQRILDDDPTGQATRHQLLWDRMNELRKDSDNWGDIS